MKEQLEQIKANALTALEAAATPAALEELRVKLLGKKGELTAVLKQMGKLSAEERPVMGQLANSVRGKHRAGAGKAEGRHPRRRAGSQAGFRSHRRDHPRQGRVHRPSASHESGAADHQGHLCRSWAIEVVDGPEVELAALQLHPAEHRGRPPLPRPLRYLLFHRRRQRSAPHPDQPHADPRTWRSTSRPSAYAGSRPRVPQGRGRRHPLPHVPSDRGSGGGRRASPWAT